MVDNITLLPRGQKPKHVVAGERLGAKKVNEIIDAIGSPIRLRGLAYRNTTSGIDYESISFGVVLATNDDEDAVVRVKSGNVITATNLYAVDETDFIISSDLGGYTEYLYVQFVYWNGSESVVSIEHSATLPTSTNDAFRVPLVKLTANGSSYDIEKVYHFGDLYFVAPLR